MRYHHWRYGTVANGLIEVGGRKVGGRSQALEIGTTAARARRSTRGGALATSHCTKLRCSRIPKLLAFPAGTTGLMDGPGSSLTASNTS